MSQLIQRTVEELKRDEGFVPHAYQDSGGWWTIGYGTLIDKRRGGGIDEAEAEYLLRNRLIRLLAEITEYRFFSKCNEARQGVLANMAYNLGVKGLLGFEKMIAAIEVNDWDRAADEMLDSKAARQTGRRYQRLAAAMREG